MITDNLLEGKDILDACCGSKMFWFQKDNPRVLFADIRSESHTLCDGRNLEINPDIICDFRLMPFPDDWFSLVVFDPPHLNKLGKSSWMAKKYGVLLPTWEIDIKQGILECLRVLKPSGTLIFKWNENQISVERILKILPKQPLFGHTTARNGHTIWITFIKD